MKPTTPKQRVQRILRHAYCRAFNRFDLSNGYTVWTGHVVPKGFEAHTCIGHATSPRKAWELANRCVAAVRGVDAVP